MKILLIVNLTLLLLVSTQELLAQGPSPFDQYNQSAPQVQQPYAQQPYQGQAQSPYAQPPSQQYQTRPMPPPPPPYQMPPPSLRDYSLIYIDEPLPKEYMVNDIVTVIVSERSEVTLNSRFNRQRTSSLKSELKDFIRLGEGLRLENTATTGPSIDANQQERLQTSGQVTDAEGITYRIAATIVDIRPNGNIVLEARKSIDANDDLWEYTLHGEIRYEDIARNNTVLSENIANLNIEKRQKGRTFSSTNRRWGTKLFDALWPF